MSKQEKRARTLLEYMGFKDPDIKSNDHDDWCLRLLNDEVIKTFFHNKMVKDIELSPETFIKISKDGKILDYFWQRSNGWDSLMSVFKCGCKVDWTTSNYGSNEHRGIINYDNCINCKNHHNFKHKDSCYGTSGYVMFEKFEKELQPHFDIIKTGIQICKQYSSTMISKYITDKGELEENLKIDIIKDCKEFTFPYITNIKKQLEYVLSNQTNNFRFGFLDVSAWIDFDIITNLIVDGKIISKFSRSQNHKSIMFFEVKINTPTLGEITREVEYYKDVISTIYRINNIQPIVISSRKYQLPEQFDSVTFDEFSTLFPRKNQLDFNEMEKQ